MGLGRSDCLPPFSNKSRELAMSARPRSDSSSKWSIVAEKALLSRGSSSDVLSGDSETSPHHSSQHSIDESDSQSEDSPSIGKLSGRSSSNSILDDISQGRFDNWDPDTCVKLLSMPTVQNYAGIKKLLCRSDNSWMLQFLELDGLDVLLESLSRLSESTGYSGKFQDALLQLECVSCVHAVMNSKIGLEYIISHKSYTRRFAKALDTSNVLLKKQVVELLSALCIYNDEGRDLALDVLQKYKELKNLRYRSSFIIDELKDAKVFSYIATLLAFVNCIILSTEDLKQRNHVRNEFLGLGILDVVQSVREDDADIAIQCDVFDQSKHKDDQLAENMGIRVDSSHYDLFQSVLNKVCSTPQEFSFLMLLHHINCLDPKDLYSDSAWNFLENISEKIANKNGNYDDLLQSARERIQHTRHTQTKLSLKSTRRRQLFRQSMRQDVPDAFDDDNDSNGFSCSEGSSYDSEEESSDDERFYDSVEIVESAVFASHPKNQMTSVLESVPETEILSSSSATGSPPSPPPLPSFAPPPPPPPLPPPPLLPCATSPVLPQPLQRSTGINSEPLAECTEQAILKISATPVLSGKESELSKLSQSIAPLLSRSKMKTLNWSKVPDDIVTGKKCLWNEIQEEEKEYKLNVESLIELFSQKPPQEKGVAERPKASNQVSVANLLDPRRSLNVNVFLRQFKKNPEEIAELVRACDHEGLGGAERLHTLTNVLPEAHELAMVKAYNGTHPLGFAERFFLAMSKVAAFRTRVEGMLQLCEFQPTVDTLKQQLNAFIETCQEIMSNKALKDFLHLVLVTGNYINAGSYAGNAAGFRLCTLPKLMETKANKPRVTLLHYLVEVAEKQDAGMLSFISDLKFLSTCARLSTENLSLDVQQLKKSIKKLHSLIASDSEDLKGHFEGFVQCAESVIVELEDSIAQIKQLRILLANHFCENEETFELEECLSLLNDFCLRIVSARKENLERQAQEKRMERLKMQKNLKGKSHKGLLKEPNDEGCIVDRLLADIRKGDFKLKKT